MEYIYCRNAANRKKEFQIKTCIIQNQGKKNVIKEAIYSEGIENIYRIHKNAILLREVYGDMYTDENLVDDKIIIQFWDNTTSLGDKLREAVLKNDVISIKSIFKLWRKLIIGKDNNMGAFSETEQFINIFGKYPQLKGCEATYISNIDCTSENILFFNESNEIKIIDYEWTFDFMIPVDFILYYGISLFCYHNFNLSIQNSLMQYANIKINEISIFEQMKTNFYDYISIDSKIRRDYRKKGKLFLEARYDIRDLQNNLKYRFPEEKLPINSRIVIYGAGSVGSDYYSYAYYSNKYVIAGWVDKKADTYKNMKRPVDNVESLRKVEFDYVIIGILDEKVAVEIKNELLKEGIVEEKIIWSQPKKN